MVYCSVSDRVNDELYTGMDVAKIAIKKAITRVRQAKGDHASPRLSKELDGFGDDGPIYRVWGRKGEEEFRVVDKMGPEFRVDVEAKNERHQKALPSQREMHYGGMIV